MTTPPPPTLIVTADDIARRLGLTVPMDDDTRWRIEQAIQDAQADVSAYLGRSLTPDTVTESGLIPVQVDGVDYWDLKEGPVLSITSTVAETYPDTGQPTGRYTVTYTAGIDSVTDPALAPVRRYVMVHAMYSPGVQLIFRTELPDRARRAQSVSVEGQAVTYDDTYSTSGATPGSGAPGALPTLKELDRWRVAGRRVVRRQARWYEGQPWPYDYYYRPGDWRRWW